MHWLLVLVLVMISGCIHQDLPPPEAKRPIISTEPMNYNDANSILKAHPEWVVDLQKASKEYHVPPSLILSIMYKESTFKPNVRGNDGSLGYSQAKEIVWKDFIEARGRKIGIGLVYDRTDFGDSALFIAWNVKRISKALKTKDVRVIYLAYNMGIKGYKTHKYKGKANQFRYRSAIEVAKRAKMYHFQLVKNVHMRPFEQGWYVPNRAQSPNIVPTKTIRVPILGIASFRVHYLSRNCHFATVSREV